MKARVGAQEHAVTRLRFWSIVGLLGASAAGFAALPFHSLDADLGRFERPRPGEARPAVEVYVEDGKRYAVFEDAQDQPWHRGLSLRPAGHPNGASFAFRACAGPATASDACPAQRSAGARNVADRIELLVDGSMTGRVEEDLKFGVSRYLAYDLMLGTDTEAPLNWTLLQQVWQLHNSSPPFAVFLRRDPRVPKTAGEDLRRVPLELVLVVRDEADRGKCTGTQPCGRVVSGTPMPIQRGQWTRLVLMLRPSAEPTLGRVLLWRDRACVAPGTPPDAVFRGAWGYPARDPVRQTYDPAIDRFDVRVGIYRRQQPRQLSVYFDEVRLGRALGDVTPRC
jgi:Polysaccharide lyase